jgi:Putative DNA-binding domain
MSLANKPIESLDESDLHALIDDEVPEGKIIDYKELLPGGTDADKKEFLADVSSFANAAGGYLIIGMKEQAGVPTALPGLQNINADAEIARLENLIRDGIRPRIPGLAIRALPLLTSSAAIVIRVPRSWALPHVVDYKGHWRFYSRNSAGKYPLDVGEVRAAFALSETTAERIRNFRTERLSLIVAGEAPVALDSGAKTVLHIVPLAAFDPGAKFDVASLAQDPSRLQPMSAMGWSRRHNFDSLLSYTQDRELKTVLTYLQIFRNGSIEAVEALLLSPGDSRRIIPSLPYEQELLNAVPRFLSIQRDLGVEPPLSNAQSLGGFRLYFTCSPWSDWV